jgi:hypothetical protein
MLDDPRTRALRGTSSNARRFFLTWLTRRSCILACKFCIFEFYRTSAWPFVWETIASGTPAASWSCRKKWDLTDEGAPEGCGWNHIFDLLLSRILTVCAQQELHLRQEDAYSDGIK